MHFKNQTGENDMQGLESITACCNAHSCSILPAELLSKHTTFRIGGACQAMVQIANREGLQAILSVTAFSLGRTGKWQQNFGSR